MTTLWEMHDDPTVDVTGMVSRVEIGPARPAGALTANGHRLMGCSTCEGLKLHTARLGSVYWTCAGCGSIRETSPCKPEDFPSEAPPAVHFTGNLPVTGQEDGRDPVCSICRGAADVQAYYAPEGRTGQLVPWCFGCVSSTAGLVVGAGIALTLLPLDPIPGEAELRAQLDRAQRGDGAPVDHHVEARAAVRRTAPAGRKPGEWR